MTQILKSATHEIIRFNMHTVKNIYIYIYIYIYVYIYHNMIQFYITRSMHIETFVTNKHARFETTAALSLATERRHMSMLGTPAFTPGHRRTTGHFSIDPCSFLAEPSVLIDWHYLTSHCSQAGTRNHQNGTQLFLPASDRHPNRLHASFLRFQCASMTESVLSTIATLWHPCTPLYTDFLGLQTVCAKQSSKRIGCKPTA